MNTKFLKRGHKSKELKPFGSFEGWSSVVREAVVWVGLPDPCLTRTKLAESADTTGDALGQLVAACQQYDWSERGVVVSTMLRELYPSNHGPPPGDDASVAMRAALENLVNCPPGKVPTPRQVGNKLRQVRRRVVEGSFLDVAPDRSSSAERNAGRSLLGVKHIVKENKNDNENALSSSIDRRRCWSFFQKPRGI